MRVAHTLPAVWPSSRPERFAANVQRTPEGCRLALLGLPDDTGVKLNFGRPGAVAGPAAFRRALAGFGAAFDGGQRVALDVRVFDAGDVEPATGDDERALLETHRRVELAARELHELGLIVVGIGGGHDLTLPAVTALSKHAGHAVGGVNVDAHLDVRQRVGSGMPFRRLIEGGFLRASAFTELGLGRFANEQGDFEWLAAQGARLLTVDQLLTGGAEPGAALAAALTPGRAFLSVDLDGLDGSVAPGVSARNPLGLGLAQVAALCEAAGASERLHHFDLMELSPPYDLDDRTARAAAYLFLSFVAGLMRRPT